MARRINISNKIYRNDFNKDSSTLALKLPMNNFNYKTSSELFNMSYTTEEQAVSNFINLLLTKDGERFMQPNFGVGLMLYIFEQNTSVLKPILKRKIEDQAALWLPYITIKEIRIDSYDNKLGDENSLNIQIVFSVTQTGANRVVTVYANERQDINIEVE